jgi:hypothetical protein
VNRIASIRVISFLLLAACGALCQSKRSSADLLQGLQFDGSDSPERQRQEMRTWESLPDAPSAQPPTQAEKFRTFVDEARSPLTFGAAGVNAGIMRENRTGTLMIKLNLHSTVELVLYAVRNEIIHVALPAMVFQGPQIGNGRAEIAYQGAN